MKEPAEAGLDSFPFGVFLLLAFFAGLGRYRSPDRKSPVRSLSPSFAHA